MAGALSDYEDKALVEIKSWKNPNKGWLSKVSKVANWPLEKAGDIIMNTPGVDWVIEKSVGGLMSLLNDLAHWSVRPEAICEDFRDCGHDVQTPADIFQLDLEHVDRVIGWLGAKYKSMAAVEGGTTGVAGLPGIPADVVALITMNQRAIGEYATHCGFDVSSQAERLYAMNVLGLASSPSDAAKQVAMAQLVRIAKDVAKKKAWRELEQQAFVKIIQTVANGLGIRLTKAKLAQSIPAIGAGVGAGFNAYFTTKVTDAAFFLYRERFLAQKYGPDIII